MHVLKSSAIIYFVRMSQSSDCHTLKNPLFAGLSENFINKIYDDGNVRMKALMKIKLHKRYKPTRFTFEKLRDEYGMGVAGRSLFSK